MEKEAERALFKSVVAGGGKCIKMDPTYNAGIPDRLVLLPGGVVVWVELKRRIGGKISPLQNLWRRELKQLGHSVVYLRGVKEVNDWVAKNDL